MIQEWIKKVSSKEYLNGDFQLSAPHSCQGDLRRSAQSCSWGRCDEDHSGRGSLVLPGGRGGLEGEWTRGQLGGRVTLTMGGQEVETSLYHNSCPQPGLVTRESEDWTIVAWRDPASGLMSGPAWLLYSHGEGALYTELGEETPATSLSLALFTGESVTWLYPDLATGLTGHFVAGTMLSASEAEVSSVSMSDNVRIPKLAIRKITDSDVYKFDPSTDVHLSSDPLIRDPYEKQLLDVTESGVPGAGVGVFARRSLDNNTMVGYFNGVHRDRAEVLSSKGKKSVYLVEGTWEGEMLDIPEEFTSWSSYRASAGHLINHSTESNVDYTECRHPRFGHILCVVTTRKIGAGKELFVKVKEVHLD